MVKGVIFDWDGTIVENTNLWFLAINKAREELGFPQISFERFTTPVGSAANQDSTGLSDIPQPMITQAVQSWVYNYEEMREGARVVTGVKDLIMKLKKEGYKIGVVTGGHRDRVIKEMKNFKLDKFIDVVITRDEAIHDKPNPAGLKLATEKMKLSPGECVYIGDMDVDVIAAKNCDMFSISVNWGSHDIEELTKLNPHHAASDSNELYKAIKKL